MKRTAYWLLVNTGFAAAVWFGWWQGIEGARNLAGAYVVLAFVVGLLCLPDRSIKNIAKTPDQPPARRIGSALVAWFALGTFLWHGSLVTATAWAVWMLCALTTRLAVKKHRANQDAAA